MKKKYYKNDKKVITLHIDEEKELYNSLDPLKDTLSDKVTDYLERSAETLLPFNEIKIKIKCEKPINIKNFERCLKIHYGIETLNFERIEKLVKKKKTFLLLVAILTAITFLFITTFDEIRYFILSLSIWEFIDMNLYNDEEEDIKNYIIEMLAFAEVIE